MDAGPLDLGQGAAEPNLKLETVEAAGAVSEFGKCWPSLAGRAQINHRRDRRNCRNSGLARLLLEVLLLWAAVMPMPSLGPGSVTAIWTAARLVGIDTAGVVFAQRTLEVLRNWDDGPIHTVIYTHGHVDHTSGITGIDAEADARGCRGRASSPIAM